jgi:hypothetical protein
MRQNGLARTAGVLGALAAALVIAVTVGANRTGESTVGTAPPLVARTPVGTPQAAPTTASAAPSSSRPGPDSTTRSPAERSAAAAAVVDAVRDHVPAAQVGLEVYDRKSRTVLARADATRQFPAMSVVKLLIAVDVLARNQWALPAPATRQQLTTMLSTSDDDLANRFWEAGGGGAVIDRDIALMGLQGTAPPAEPSEWGDTEITARDTVTVYRYIVERIPAPARDLLYDAMSDAPRIAADGTDQYFGIPDGLPGSAWAIKQGWGSSGADADYDTTGLVGADARYIVVILAQAPINAYPALPAALTAGTAHLADLLR